MLFFIDENIMRRKLSVGQRSGTSDVGSGPLEVGEGSLEVLLSSSVHVVMVGRHPGVVVPWYKAPVWSLTPGAGHVQWSSTAHHTSTPST